MKFSSFIIISLLITSFSTSHAQQKEDVKESSDHALLSRYEGSYINRYSRKEFEQFVYPNTAKLVNYNKLENSTTVEGELFMIEYVSPASVTATQVFRTYQTKLKEAGFKTLFTCRAGECGDMPMHYVRDYVENTSSQIGNAMVGKKGSYLVASGTFQNEPYIVSIIVGDDNRTNTARYLINIVKIEELDTDKVDVSSVTDKLKAEGRFAFYGIHFDTNSADIKGESDEAMQVIADYLKANTNTNVLIVGHTDNTGDFAHNVNLSKQRAEAVVSQLTGKYGIPNGRVTPVGVGMAAPVAPNSDEEGRALNRRVELVIK
jgi:OOP family OmpA-OmpF porin